jgi:hypothetical protein
MDTTFILPKLQNKLNSISVKAPRKDEPACIDRNIAGVGQPKCELRDATLAALGATLSAQSIACVPEPATAGFLEPGLVGMVFGNRKDKSVQVERMLRRHTENSDRRRPHDHVHSM